LKPGAKRSLLKQAKLCCLGRVMRFLAPEYGPQVV